MLYNGFVGFSGTELLDWEWQVQEDILFRAFLPTTHAFDKVFHCASANYKIKQKHGLTCIDSVWRICSQFCAICAPEHQTWYDTTLARRVGHMLRRNPNQSWPSSLWFPARISHWFEVGGTVFAAGKEWSCSLRISCHRISIWIGKI